MYEIDYKECSDVGKICLWTKSNVLLQNTKSKVILIHNFRRKKMNVGGMVILIKNAMFPISFYAFHRKRFFPYSLFSSELKPLFPSSLFSLQLRPPIVSNCCQVDCLAFQLRMVLSNLRFDLSNLKLFN